MSKTFPFTSSFQSFKMSQKDVVIEKTNHASIIQRNDYWEIVMIKCGKGKHIIDFTSSTYHDNSVHIIMPHQIHQMNMDKDSKILSLLISNDFFHYALENSEFVIQLGKYQLLNQVPILKFDMEEFNQLWELLVNIKIEGITKNEMQSTILKSYLNIFLCKCYTKLNPIAKSKYSLSDRNLLISFRYQIEQYFNRYNKIHYYLDLLNVTDKKLSAICFSYLGVSPSDYLHSRILIESKRLLRYGKLCQKEIAHQLNFTDVSHFMKFFKQRTGILPSEFATNH